MYGEGNTISHSSISDKGDIQFTKKEEEENLLSNRTWVVEVDLQKLLFLRMVSIHRSETEQTKITALLLMNTVETVQDSANLKLNDRNINLFAVNISFLISCILGLQPRNISGPGIFL